MSAKPYVFILMSVLTLLGGCTKKERTSEKSKPATDVATSVKPLTDIQFFLETSASMGGYLKGNTEFKNIVAEVVTKLGQLKPISLNTISAGQPTPLKTDVNGFVSTLATTPLATGKSSELHRIFGQVGEVVKPGTVAVLVSDCILSFPDPAIRANPEINKTDASSTLKNNINNQFVAFGKRGIGATVLAYTSAFNGTYYTYQNQKQKLAGEKRPFYIWLIGTQPDLNAVNAHLSAQLSDKPQQRLDFGSVTPIQSHALFFSLNKKGEWAADKGNVAEIKTGRKAVPAEFAVGLDLAKLPAYVQAETYIRQNLNVNATSGSVKLVNVQPKAAVTTARLNEREQQLLNHQTHVLTFRVEQLLDKQATVTISLPVKFDNWYVNWSTMDDRTPVGRKDRTFALQYLINGVREAYTSADNDFMKTTITLTKD